MKTSSAMPYSKFMQIKCFEYKADTSSVQPYLVLKTASSENLAALRILKFYHKMAMRKFDVKSWNGFYALCVHTSTMLSCYAWCNLKLLKLNYLISLAQQTYQIVRMDFETFSMYIFYSKTKATAWTTVKNTTTTSNDKSTKI